MGQKYEGGSQICGLEGGVHCMAQESEHSFIVMGTTVRHLHALSLETPSCARAHAPTYPGAAENSPLAADQQQPMPVASGAGSRQRRGACAGAWRKIWYRSGPKSRRDGKGIQR
eukprot:1148163-Pelagomonas_calceolata.AAC.2